MIAASRRSRRGAVLAGGRAGHRTEPEPVASGESTTHGRTVKSPFELSGL
jgi:hypothetical protein